MTEPTPIAPEIFRFEYLNHRGEKDVRHITYPIDFEFQFNPGYGYQPGWFLPGSDLDRGGDRRSFALNRIILGEPTGMGNKAFRLFRIMRDAS